MNARQKRDLEAFSKRSLELASLGIEPGVIGNPERLKRQLRTARALAERRRQRARKP